MLCSGTAEEEQGSCRYKIPIDIYSYAFWFDLF